MVGRLRPVHSQHPCVIRIRSREGAFSHQGIRDRGIHLLRKLKQFLSRIRENRTSAYEDIRLFCLLNHICGSLKLHFVHTLSSPWLDDLLWLIFCHIGRHVLRNINEHRSWPSPSRNAKCSADRIRKLIYILYNIVMLCDRHSDASDINLLETIFSKERDSYVTGDGHHRNGIHVGCGNSGHQVCGSRSTCGKAYPHFSCRSGIAVCRMGRPLLMGSQDMADFILVLIQCIVHIEDSAARISEHCIYTLLF